MIPIKARTFTQPHPVKHAMGLYHDAQWNQGIAIWPGKVLMLLYPNRQENGFVQVVEIIRNLNTLADEAKVTVRGVDMRYRANFGSLDHYSYKWLRDLTEEEMSKYLSQFV
jgi:hypothetical protein